MATDVMTVGGPNEPLPGPRTRAAIRRNIAELLADYMEAAEIRPVNEVVLHYLKVPQNPILEEPMWFPGYAWKGTSGMPQHRYV